MYKLCKYKCKIIRMHTIVEKIDIDFVSRAYVDQQSLNMFVNQPIKNKKCIKKFDKWIRFTMLIVLASTKHTPLNQMSWLTHKQPLLFMNNCCDRQGFNPMHASIASKETWANSSTLICRLHICVEKVYKGPCIKYYIILYKCCLALRATLDIYIFFYPEGENIARREAEGYTFLPRGLI